MPPLPQLGLGTTGALVALLLAPGCGSPPGPRPGPGVDARAHGAADKARIYGDPALVPTREGERIRLEVALAGELEAALTTLPGVARAHVNITLPAAASEPGRASVVLVGPAAAAHREDAARLARALTPALTEGQVEVTAVDEAAGKEHPDTGQSPKVRWILVLLGLGASLGITLDRLARRLPRGPRGR